MSSPALRVSKLDAARRQLEIAVRLYFSASDPVSIHTLTSAAYQVLSDVNRARAWQIGDDSGRPLRVSGVV